MENDKFRIAEEEKEEVTKKKKLHIIFIILQIFVLIAVFLVLLNFGEYGYSLFCIIPFSIGLTIGSYTRTFRSKKILKGVGFFFLIIALLASFLVAAKFEGAICILMALGMICLPGLLGVFIGYLIRNSLKIFSILAILFLNTSAITYDLYNNESMSSVASKSILINSSKENIWKVLTNPVKFSNISNIFFKAGVSYPKSMYIDSDSNKKSFLNCNYTNGSARFFIEHLDSLQRMRFIMQEDITSMKELTFYEKINAPHLVGYFKPKYGEFKIQEINLNHCLLIATTSYSYKISPAFYWRWWTDYLANTMHFHVLSDIKKISEK